MNSADIIGWSYDAACYCLDCAEPEGVDQKGNKKHPIFCGEESDSPMSCDTCYELIEGAVCIGASYNPPLCVDCSNLTVNPSLAPDCCGLHN